MISAVLLLGAGGDERGVCIFPFWFVTNLKVRNTKGCFNLVVFAKKGMFYDSCSHAVRSILMRFVFLGLFVFHKSIF